MDMHKIAKVTKRHQQVDLYMSTDMTFFFNEPPGVFLLITLRDAAGSCNHWWQCPEVPFLNSWNKFLSLWKPAVTLRASNGFPWLLFLQSFQQSYKLPHLCVIILIDWNTESNFCFVVLTLTNTGVPDVTDPGSTAPFDSRDQVPCQWPSWFTSRTCTTHHPSWNDLLHGSWLSGVLRAGREMRWPPSWKLTQWSFESRQRDEMRHEENESFSTTSQRVKHIM